VDSSPHILMCPPDFYGIDYEINAWMDRTRQADRDLAVRQWHDLYRLLQESGAAISLLPPVAGLPDLVFTANAAMVYQDTAILSHFRPRQRQPEEPCDEKWFSEHGFQVRRLGACEKTGTGSEPMRQSSREKASSEVPVPIFSQAPGADVFFEGAGDALFCGDTLLAGYRIRSDIRGHQEIGAMLDCRVIPLELVNPRFYHLDTCFCPLAPDSAICYPPALDDYGQRVLPELIGDLIAVTDAEARQMACNAVVVGRTVITNTGCPDLHRQLRTRGFEPQETPLGEFLKAGGSAKCLTLRLDGEEAAAWKVAQAGIARMQ
jgi:N-dimethylarginine dimethylaminohydrolase